MFHKITHLLKFFHNPPATGSPEFRHLQQMLERRHVLDAAGCLRRAFQRGWRFFEIRMCIERYSELRAIDAAACTPGLLYDHLNVAPRGELIGTVVRRTDDSLLAEEYAIARNSPDPGPSTTDAQT